MKKIAERMRGCIETLSLSALLVINLSFMVLLMLGLCTVLVITGADGGFIYHDGRIGIWGVLCFIYAVCSLIAVSMVVMMRMVFIHPLQRNIEAMKKLANGDFTVRVNHAEHGYVPREMVEFEQSFNKAAEELGAPPQMLSRPNDILAIEYLKALRQQKAPMEPLAVLRQGAGHDGTPSGDTASASYLRTLLRSGRTDEALSYLPAPAAQVLRRELALGQAPADLSYCRRAILARLRQLREEDFLPYDGGKEGLYHRFYQAVRTSCSPEELLETAKTKRYPTSRLRRMLLSAWLDVTPPAGGIPYLRVLAANGRGRDLLRQMQRRGVPVLTCPGDVSRLGPAAEALFRREALWTDLYVLTYPQPSRSVCGSDWRTNPILL